MKKSLFIFATALLLASCSKMAKKNFGLTEDMPDELQVTKAKPLEVPPHFNQTIPVKNKATKPTPAKLTKAEEEILKEAGK